MGFKPCLVALLLAFAVAVEASTKLHDAEGWSLGRYSHDSSSLFDVSVGDVLEVDDEMMLDYYSESSRRTLSGRPRYISYAALMKNGISCRRGRSYYNCGAPRKQANPYTRGCSFITRCGRRTYNIINDAWLPLYKKLVNRKRI